MALKLDTPIRVADVDFTHLHLRTATHHIPENDAAPFGAKVVCRPYRKVDGGAEVQKLFMPLEFADALKSVDIPSVQGWIAQLIAMGKTDEATLIGTVLAQYEHAVAAMLNEVGNIGVTVE